LADKSSASTSVLVAELNADLLLQKGGSAKKFRELGRYPAITRDIAMKAMALAAAKMPVRTKFVAREEAHTDAS